MQTLLRIDHWEAIFDSFLNGVIAIDKQGRIRIFNKAAERILDYARDKVLGKNVDEIVPEIMLMETAISGDILRNNTVDVKNRRFFVDNSPIVQDGRIVGAMAMLQDISNMEALSEKLDSVIEINRELDAIIESIDDGLVLVDGQGYVLRVNQAYQRLVGITAEEYVGKHVYDLLKEGYINRATSPIVIQRKSKVTVVDVRNGKELLLTGNPVFNEKGEVVRVVTVARDTTELNHLKEKLAESEQTQNRYYQELEHLRSQQPFRQIITKDPNMKQKLTLAFHVAQVDSTVLILGESGVGKDLLAELIHRASKRAKQPFIKINCAAIPANLLESELFGYEPGAFTGAQREGKLGMFELAQGGTLFLDEIGDLSLYLQVKVLRAIQEKVIVRVGGSKSINLNVRIIAATNRDLKEMVKHKTFRHDLFYRLNVVPIELMPLRERKEDIVPLINEFLDRFNKLYGFQKWLHPKVVKYFLNHDWPGNIRELENTIERLVVISRNDCIDLDTVLQFTTWGEHYQLAKENSSLKSIIENKEKEILFETYRELGSTRKTAAVLGISQSSVVKKLKKYNNIT
ncbi:MAG: sigma 54-interacting transcriptional regulator [Bacillota bacterium]